MSKYGHLDLEEKRIRVKSNCESNNSTGGHGRETRREQETSTCKRTRVELPPDFSLATPDSGKHQSILSELQGKTVRTENSRPSQITNQVCEQINHMFEHCTQ